MIVFLNDRFVPEEQALVSVFDRSFLYGDGLFETMRIYGGKPFRWAQHLHRLQRGAEFLGIQFPMNERELYSTMLELLRLNEMVETVLRIHLSRGIGPRGYSPKGARHPVLVMSLHPAPPLPPAGGDLPQWSMITSLYQVPAMDLLSTHKTCNKLPQVMARAEAEAEGADEALILNNLGMVAEATTSNLFWIEGEGVWTTPIASGILPGVTRAFIAELCQWLDLPYGERAIHPKTLLESQGVFLTLSTWELVEVKSLDDHTLCRSPLVTTLAQTYRSAVSKEIARA